MDSETIYSFNSGVRYQPNKGKNLEFVKTKDLLNISIVVKKEYGGSSPDSTMFPIVFRNIFTHYLLSDDEKDKGYSVRTKSFNDYSFNLWQT